MNQREYDAIHGYREPQHLSVFQKLKDHAQLQENESPISNGLKKNIYRRIPFLRWIRKYQLKAWLPSDFLAGCTLGIYNIPQGMAYSVLASLPPVYGLYVSFFPPLIYLIFGSSFHTSIGVFSLTSLMIAQTRLDILPDFANGTHATEFQGINDLNPVDIVMSLSMLTGFIQLTMCILRLDFLTCYLSDPAIAGLTFAASIQAFITQIPELLGIKLDHNDHRFMKVFYTLKDIILLIPDANLMTVFISSGTIVILLLSKIFLEPKTKSKGFPFPTELIVLIVATSISAYMNVAETFEVKIIDEVPVGMPMPRVPKFSLMPFMVPNAISIAIVAYALTVSMGKLFATKHKYRIDCNQELLVLGLSGVVCSFFSVFPASTSLSRTLVNEASNAKTQISGLIASIIVLTVILWFGPLLKTLPMCILSSIVVVALRFLLTKYTEIPKLWRFSKCDVSVSYNFTREMYMGRKMAVWVGTALVTLCYDIIQGLAAGVVIAVFFVVVRSQWPGFYVLGGIGPNDYRRKSCYDTVKTKPAAPIVRFDSPLIFTNCELFKDRVRSLMSTPKHVRRKNLNPAWRAVIFDCSAWVYTDAMGIAALQQLNSELREMNVIMMLVGLKKNTLWDQIDRAGLIALMYDYQFYPNTENALLAAAALKIDSDLFLNGKTKCVA